MKLSKITDIIFILSVLLIAVVLVSAGLFTNYTRRTEIRTITTTVTVASTLFGLNPSFVLAIACGPLAFLLLYVFLKKPWKEDQTVRS